MYFIRERIKDSAWDFRVLDADGHFTEYGHAFQSVQEAVDAWNALTPVARAGAPRAYIIGPKCGCYHPDTGKRMRKDPEA